MFCAVMRLVSWAMSASMMRERAALRFSATFCRLEMVDSNRFCTAPKSPRLASMASRAESTRSRAWLAPSRVVMSMTFTPLVVSTGISAVVKPSAAAAAGSPPRVMLLPAVRVRVPRSGLVAKSPLVAAGLPRVAPVTASPARVMLRPSADTSSRVLSVLL